MLHYILSPGSHRLGERFQCSRVLLLSVYFMPRSIQRGAFFLTAESQKEGSARCQQSLWIALSSTGHGDWIKFVDVMQQLWRVHEQFVRGWWDADRNTKPVYKRSIAPFSDAAVPYTCFPIIFTPGFRTCIVLTVFFIGGGSLQVEITRN